MCLTLKALKNKHILINFMYQIIDSYDKINQLKKDFK